jgi:hypothetical protein
MNCLYIWLIIFTHMSLCTYIEIRPRLYIGKGVVSLGQHNVQKVEWRENADFKLYSHFSSTKIAENGFLGQSH